MLYLFAKDHKLSPLTTLCIIISLRLEVGINRFIPIVSRSPTIEFISFILSTEVLNFLAIEYKVSPFCTSYTLPSLIISSSDGVIIEVPLGIFNSCPIDILSLVKSLYDFNSLTDILFFDAIEYKVSPLLTI